jgi:hypothetical protein
VNLGIRLLLFDPLATLLLVEGGFETNGDKEEVGNTSQKVFAMDVIIPTPAAAAALAI